MAKQRYRPPEQGKAGMMIDAVLVLALVFVSLSAPLWIQNLVAPAEEAAPAEAEAAAAPSAPPTWESLGQNATMAEQWQKLGFDEAGAAEIINQRFDYSIDPVRLVVTIALIVGYFIFLLRVSEKEYREVIAEKFD